MPWGGVCLGSLLTLVYWDQMRFWMEMILSWSKLCAVMGKASFGTSCVFTSPVASLGENTISGRAAKKE